MDSSAFDENILKDSVFENALQYVQIYFRGVISARRLKLCRRASLNKKNSGFAC